MTPRKKIGCYCIEVCKRDDPANNGLRCIGLPAELPGEKSNEHPAAAHYRSLADVPDPPETI